MQSWNFLSFLRDVCVFSQEPRLVQDLLALMSAAGNTPFCFYLLSSFHFRGRDWFLAFFVKFNLYPRGRARHDLTTVSRGKTFLCNRESNSFP